MPMTATAPRRRAVEPMTSHHHGDALRARPGRRTGERRGCCRAGASSVMLIATSVSAAPEEARRIGCGEGLGVLREDGAQSVRGAAAPAAARPAVAGGRAQELDEL